jgi:hypothetical protein
MKFCGMEIIESGDVPPNCVAFVQPGKLRETDKGFEWVERPRLGGKIINALTRR